MNEGSYPNQIIFFIFEKNKASIDWNKINITYNFNRGEVWQREQEKKHVQKPKNIETTPHPPWAQIDQQEIERDEKVANISQRRERETEQNNHVYINHTYIFNNILKIGEDFDDL